MNIEAHPKFYLEQRFIYARRYYSFIILRIVNHREASLDVKFKAKCRLGSLVDCVKIEKYNLITLYLVYLNKLKARIVL